MGLSKKARQELETFAKQQEAKTKAKTKEVFLLDALSLGSDKAELKRAVRGVTEDALTAFGGLPGRARRRRDDDFLLSPIPPKRKPLIDWSFLKYFKFWKVFTWLWNLKI